MQSPQLENGYTKISNELLEAMCAVQLSGHEWSVVHTVIRKTYGYNKKSDWVSLSQLCELTGLIKQRVNEAKQKLINKRIIIQEGRMLSLNKHYDQWQKVTEKRYQSNGKALQKVTENRAHKRKKENIQNTLDERGSSGSKKRNDMAWNKQPDDYEELSIDIDGDGSPKTVKTPTKKYPNAPAIRKIFQEVLGRNPSNWKINRNQLLACENLYTERGPEKVRSALEYYQANREDQYCPTIASPYDLDSKWTNLGEHKLKHGNH